MGWKLSLLSHLHAGFYSAEKSYVVLKNFIAGDIVESQEWCYRCEGEQPTRLLAPRLVLQSGRVHLMYLLTRGGPVFLPSLSFAAAFTTM